VATLAELYESPNPTHPPSPTPTHQRS
jgi:hypothetical protein